jgi:integrase/recombinase XerD
MLAACGDDIGGKRNQALVALGFQGLCRRSEISALEVPDLIENIRGGLSVTIRRGKADQAGEGGLSGYHRTPPVSCPGIVIQK